MPIPDALPEGKGSIREVIWGVDVGMRRLAFVCPETEECHEIRLRPTTSATNRHQLVLADWITETIPPGHTLWVESAIQGKARNVQTTVKIAMTVGTVLGTYRGEAYEVAISSWKKAVIGHGGADKPAVQEWLEHNRPSLAAACQDSEDLRDAACVGIYGQLRAAGTVEAPSRVPRRRRSGAVLRPA